MVRPNTAAPLRRAREGKLMRWVIGGVACSSKPQKCWASADTHPCCLRRHAFCRQPNPSLVPADRPSWGRLCGAPRRSLARRSRNPGQPKLCACETCRQRPSGAATAGLDSTGPGAGWGAPGQPATRVPADLDRNRKGAPSPPRSNVRRSTKLATRSPWQGAAVGRQAGSARVGTRHSHAVPP